jgi:hypothetical protein
MSEVGSPERITQNRVVKRFQNELGYTWAIGNIVKTIAILKKNCSKTILPRNPTPQRKSTKRLIN